MKNYKYIHDGRRSEWWSIRRSIPTRSHDLWCCCDRKLPKKVIIFKTPKSWIFSDNSVDDKLNRRIIDIVDRETAKRLYSLKGPVMQSRKLDLMYQKQLDQYTEIYKELGLTSNPDWMLLIELSELPPLCYKSLLNRSFRKPRRLIERKPNLSKPIT